MNEKLIRTFLSIPVPPEVRTKKNMLYSTLEDSPAQINWVANKNLHLTIKFIGFTPESTFKSIINTLKNITENLNPFTLEIKNTEQYEIGVMTLVTAKTQELTNEISQMLNPFLLHHPLTKYEELPTFSFPFSPADIRRGAIYSFCLHHTWEIDDPLEIFNKEILQIG